MDLFQSGWFPPVTVQSTTQTGLNEKESLLAHVTGKVRKSTSFRHSWIWVLKYGYSPSVGSGFPVQASFLSRCSQYRDKDGPWEVQAYQHPCVHTSFPVTPCPLSLSWVLRPSLNHLSSQGIEYIPWPGWVHVYLGSQGGRSAPPEPQGLRVRDRELPKEQ